MVTVSGGGADLEVHVADGLGELTRVLGEIAQLGNPEDGWVCDIAKLNSLADLTPAVVDADKLLELLCDLDPWCEVL